MKFANFYSKNKFWIYFWTVLILFLIFYDIIWFYSTKFEKTVTVDDKYLRNRQKRDQYMFQDTEGNIYHVKNRMFSWEFDEAEDWNKLIKGNKYTIRGYKMRIPMIGMYPIVVDIQKS